MVGSGDRPTIRRVGLAIVKVKGARLCFCCFDAQFTRFTIPLSALLSLWSLDLLRPLHSCSMPCVHEYESQYETMEGKLYQRISAVTASAGRGRYVARSHTNHG